ncbi:UNVERIFIED_CONTAM: putative methyltransferase PMT23 [Sesamum angustifolium]|uniref:Methyltransferase n=1 Tax=Sesamum angustifolium TaxID=2727405 RepID=A0AAW2LH19_9LAMI
MAESAHSLLQERKYPFIFAFFILLIFVISLQTPAATAADLAKSNPFPSNPKTPPLSSPSNSSTISLNNDSSIGNITTDSNTNTGASVDNAAAVDDGDQVVDVEWELCEGSAAVDYIPCLDNWNAIKALPSRRHMEHRERHCPDPTPKCLVPLPKGYRIPVPWPKSRDMVRSFILWCNFSEESFTMPNVVDTLLIGALLLHHGGCSTITSMVEMCGGYFVNWSCGCSTVRSMVETSFSGSCFTYLVHMVHRYGTTMFPILSLPNTRRISIGVVKSGDYFVFPGGGTQFKNGVNQYIESIEKTLPVIEWGKKTRVILDVGCGVASFGGALLDRNVITVSFAPKDEHEAQIQFALERGIPAMLSVIGTQKLTFPDNSYDLIHCARCRVHWDADGGKPLMELNRILRPGGYFIWSATPVYKSDERDQNVWKSMVALTEAICWKVVTKTFFDSSQIGLVIYQKPMSSSCYQNRKENNPPLCNRGNRRNNSWYAPLDSCLVPLPVDSDKWPSPWPERLINTPQSLSAEPDAEETFKGDTRHWSALVSEVYLGGLGINWSSVRNVMDMNAGYGSFAAALINQPLWVMNVVPIHRPDTLSAIFDRGLIGTYHDWCESFNTYPRTYDLLHSSFLLRNLSMRYQ